MLRKQNASDFLTQLELKALNGISISFCTVLNPCKEILERIGSFVVKATCWHRLLYTLTKKYTKNALHVYMAFR